MWTPETDDEVFNRYLRQFRLLLEEAQDKLGTLEASRIVNEMVSLAQSGLTNTVTVETQAKEWLDNLKDNLDFVVSNDIDIHDEGDLVPRLRAKLEMKYGEGFPALVIGAGPCANFLSASQLKDFSGPVICTNKALSFVRAGLDRWPDVCVALDSSLDVIDSFKLTLPEDGFLDSTDFVLASQLHPEVVKFLARNVRRYRLHFFHSSIPEDYLANVDYICNLFWPSRTIDTGGNAGLLAMYLAHELGAKTTGILGLEHSHVLDKDWTDEQAAQYKIIYAPEEDQTFALTPSFQGYLMKMVDWVRQHDVVNLSEWGYPYVMRDKIPLKFMKRQEFVKEYGIKRQD